MEAASTDGAGHDATDATEHASTVELATGDKKSGGAVPRRFCLMGSVLGAIILVFGSSWIAVGSGLLSLRPWAWWLAIIVMVLSIVGSIGSPITAILPGLILLYLILVRRHFR